MRAETFGSHEVPRRVEPPAAAVCQKLHNRRYFNTCASPVRVKLGPTHATFSHFSLFSHSNQKHPNKIHPNQKQRATPAYNNATAPPRPYTNTTLDMDVSSDEDSPTCGTRTVTRYNYSGESSPLLSIDHTEPYPPLALTPPQPSSPQSHSIPARLSYDVSFASPKRITNRQYNNIGVLSPNTADRQRRRQRQIMKGKTTIGYKNYLRLTPKNRRTRNMPRTPNYTEDISKRRFDGRIRAWRRALHQWDNVQFDD